MADSDYSALIAAVVALLVGLVSVGFQVWSYLHGERLKKNRAVAEFRVPLSVAAKELSSRIDNLVSKGLGIYFTDGLPRHKEYVCENTVFLFCQFFAWQHIVHWNRSKMDLSSEEKDLLDSNLDAVRHAFSGDAESVSPVFHLFGGEQQAIGEQLVKDNISDGTPRCMTYSEYLKDESLRKYVEPLREYVKIFIVAQKAAFGMTFLLEDRAAQAAKKMRYAQIVERLLRIQKALDFIAGNPQQRHKIPSSSSMSSTTTTFGFWNVQDLEMKMSDGFEALRRKPFNKVSIEDLQRAGVEPNEITPEWLE